MSKILAVFGATGNQGGSLVEYILADQELYKQYRIRALTRDTNSDKAKALAEKVEVVRADTTDRASIETALTGVNFVFLVTVPSFTPGEESKEYDEIKLVADVAVEKHVEYIIFSTLPNCNELSNGKYTKVYHFDNKARAEAYIRGLNIRSAFVALGVFMQGLQSPLFKYDKVHDEEWTVSFPSPPDSKVVFIDVINDTGKFVGAILADPGKYEGKVFAGTYGLFTYTEFAEIPSKSSGKKITYKHITPEEFKANWPFAKDDFGDLAGFINENEFYGPGTDELVRWSVENARGKLTTWEEYLAKHPLVLE